MTAFGFEPLVRSGGCGWSIKKKMAESHEIFLEKLNISKMPFFCEMTQVSCVNSCWTWKEDLTVTQLMRFFCLFWFYRFKHRRFWIIINERGINRRIYCAVNIFTKVNFRAQGTIRFLPFFTLKTDNIVKDFDVFKIFFHLEYGLHNH